jgi:hypothetical protein
MVEYVKAILRGQYEAALCMFDQCVRACRPEHWEGRIANDTFRQVAYHTLFYTDLYLSPTETAFEPRGFHQRGGDERGPALSPGLEKDQTIAYVAICRQKVTDVLPSETPESLQGPSGFSWRRFSRGELHVYNIRHVQHHAGQMSAYLRRVDEGLRDPKSLPWVGSGWNPR